HHGHDRVSSRSTGGDATRVGSSDRLAAGNPLKGLEELDLARRERDLDIALEQEVGAHQSAEREVCRFPGHHEAEVISVDRPNRHAIDVGSILCRYAADGHHEPAGIAECQTEL